MSKDKNKYINATLDDDAILQYLEGTAAPDTIKEIEQMAVDNPFLSDAMEGLQSFNSTSDIKRSILQLNAQLQNKTNNHKTKRQLHPINISGSILIGIAIILLLAIIAFALIHFYK